VLQIIKSIFQSPAISVSLKKMIMRIFLYLMLTISSFSCLAQNKITELEPIEFNTQLKTQQDAIILDVRTPEEFAKGSIAFSRNLDFRSSNFESDLNKLNKKKTYFVYCLSGGRSGSASALMQNLGFEHVVALKGGILAWQKNNLPLESAKVNANATGIDDAEYSRLIHSDRIVLVDFYAPWCAPCRRMEPLLKEVSEFYKGKATIIRINIDENSALAKKQKIDEIPFFKYYINGEEKGNYIGELNRETFDRLLGAKP
jgi:thioredoxin